MILTVSMPEVMPVITAEVMSNLIPFNESLKEKAASDGFLNAGFKTLIQMRHKYSGELNLIPS